MWQQMGFIADQNRMLLIVLVQTHDGACDLAHQITAEVRRFQIQFQGDLAQQVHPSPEEKCTWRIGARRKTSLIIVNWNCGKPSGKAMQKWVKPLMSSLF